MKQPELLRIPCLFLQFSNLSLAIKIIFKEIIAEFEKFFAQNHFQNKINSTVKSPLGTFLLSV